MVRYKYSEVQLREAVDASLSMAGVMRHLGIRLSGGMHAHLRRRIEAAGIDRSHFRPTVSGRPVGSRKLPAQDILVLRDRWCRRAAPALLRRALAESGVPRHCAISGTGPVWQGRPLTLQVDHINGEYWDCRPTNLRLLCPNCHSQTATYAGRNRHAVTGAEAPVISTPPRRPEASITTDPAEVIRQVERRELSTSAAAQLIGCHRNQVYRLRRRLAQTGSLAPGGGGLDRGTTHREAVIAFALANPELGPRAIASGLREASTGGCSVSHGTVSNILRAAGLNTIAARHSRLVGLAGVA